MDLVFVIYLAFSKFGNIRLGSDDDEPEFSKLTWSAMLFSAGMGIGLVSGGLHPWGILQSMIAGTPLLSGGLDELLASE